MYICNTFINVLKHTSVFYKYQIHPKIYYAWHGSMRFYNFFKEDFQFPGDGHEEALLFQVTNQYYAEGYIVSEKLCQG